MFLPLKRILILSLLVSFVFLTGCPPQRPPKRVKKPVTQEKEKAPAKAAPKKATTPAAKPAAKPTAKPAAKPAPKPAPKPAAPAKAEPNDDEKAVIAMVEKFGTQRNSYKGTPQKAITELSINTDILTLDDVKLIAKLTGLEKLQFTDCRDFDDEYMK